uniref:C2H2-type domain-containing protein n=1 Tax=Ananas comosus var. bracteatus TaxID=296719 RepID=A0A6V7QYJ2_ANACO
METEKAANLLLSLSSTHTRAIDEAIRRRKKATRGAADGAFVCKTCSREFDSFQALGGHSTSHNRARSLDPAATRKTTTTTTTTTTQKHECSICGLGFSMGQALGGHMRRHRAAMEDSAAATVGARRGEEGFDLNQLPPLEDEEENAPEICGGGNGRGSERRLLELFM